MRRNLKYFVQESNRIEAITKEPTLEEMAEAERFLNLKEVTIEELERFVRIYEPQAKLRTRFNMNVRVGAHCPPQGGPSILMALQDILDEVKGGAHPYEVHQKYEALHPFMDCNGRSGRILWAWQMVNQNYWPGIDLGFLHQWYYQSLSASRLQK